MSASIQPSSQINPGYKKLNLLYNCERVCVAALILSALVLCIIIVLVQKRLAPSIIFVIPPILFFTSLLALILVDILEIKVGNKHDIDLKQYRKDKLIKKDKDEDEFEDAKTHISDTEQLDTHLADVEEETEPKEEEFHDALQQNSNVIVHQPLPILQPKNTFPKVSELLSVG